LRIATQAFFPQRAPGPVPSQTAALKAVFSQKRNKNKYFGGDGRDSNPSRFAFGAYNGLAIREWLLRRISFFVFVFGKSGVARQHDPIS
jgi:hypothetical protein